MTVNTKQLTAGLHNWVILLLTGLLLFLEPLASNALQYDRALLQADWQLWRLITAHWVHLGVTHWVMNAVGLGLVALIFQQEQSRGRDLCVFFSLSALISLFIFVFSPDIGRYVGLSGVIHGYFVYYLAVGAKQTPILCAVGWLGTVAKVLNEQRPLYDGSQTADLIGGAVAYDAHWYGVIVGTVIGLGFLAWQRYR